MDRFSITREYNKLKMLLDEMEQFAREDNDNKNDAALNYYLGTGYGTYSDYVVRFGRAHTDFD